MRPYPLADAWGAPRRTILELFLSAAKVGLLNMRWDLLCPLCRGSTVSAASLDAVHKGVHCSTCNINFESDFAKNVELTFTPHPQIRQVEMGPYCMGGPMITPHILVHQSLAAGEKRIIRVKLEPGGYRLRTQRPEVEQWLALNPEESANCLSVLIEAGALTAAVQGRSPAAGGQVMLELWNQTAEPQQIYLERADWYTDAATAVQVTTLQHFRDLFSDEVLRAGEEIGIQGITILFSDLVGSTAMYNRWGDAASYALVREQFAFLQRIVRRYDGAIVKTIGDAIMGAFADPGQGVGAALAIQAEIEKFNALHPDEPLKIKLGLHHGPCIAVNLNGRLDYFGATVNLASRLEGQSQGGDVVISERLLQDPAVAQLLEIMSVQISRFATTIKGFDEDFCLYRLKLLQVVGQA
jgi:class 3 adenylate cyclase